MLLRLSAALHLVATAALAQVGPLAPPGAPASAFPKPDRPVAEIISPIGPARRSAMPSMKPGSSFAASASRPA